MVMVKYWYFINKIEGPISLCLMITRKGIACYLHMYYTKKKINDLPKKCVQLCLYKLILRAENPNEPNSQKTLGKNDLDKN